MFPTSGRCAKWRGYSRKCLPTSRRSSRYLLRRYELSSSKCQNKGLTLVLHSVVRYFTVCRSPFFSSHIPSFSEKGGDSFLIRLIFQTAIKIAIWSKWKRSESIGIQGVDKKHVGAVCLPYRTSSINQNRVVGIAHLRCQPHKIRLNLKKFTLTFFWA